MLKQGVSDVKQIDCKKISDSEFEQLGDAVMERMAGSHEFHEQMDEMMGGEGSASLQSMHIFMGANWLGCGDGSTTGRGMMMPMMMRMMGNYYPAYYTGYSSLLNWTFAGWFLAVVFGIVLFLVWTGMIRLHKK